MAAPNYTTSPTTAVDLTDITLAESTTGWSAYGGGASGLGTGADFAMQGTLCVDKQITAADKGHYYDNGSGITLGTGDHVWVWHFCATPGLTATRANKGASILVGSGGTAYCQYHVEGSNTYGASGRVAKCYPIDYSVRSSNTGSEPYRTVTGSPAANPQVFGGGLNTTASVKGANLGIDAIRYGTGAYITAGDGTTPASFAGFQAVNDNTTYRWGILTAVGGGYELQGKFVIGQSNSGTPTACTFTDSDRNIAVVDTIHASSTFTEIIVDHASTTATLTNINITALGTTTPGLFTVNSANPTVDITGGTWTGLGVITFRSNTTADGLTLRLTDAVTLNGATLQNCTVDRNTATSAVVTTTGNMANVTGNTFISDGTGHAVNLGSVASSTSFTWDNTLSGYVAGTSGSPVTTGTSGNEAILCNVSASQTLTINVAAGATVPSVKNDGTGSVNVVSGQVTVKAKAVDVSGANVASARVFLATSAAGSLPYNASVTISNSGTTATVTHTAHGLSSGDKVVIYGAGRNDNLGVHTITVSGANTYTFTTAGSNTGADPGSTITASFCYLFGLTDANGEISMSRAFSAAQSASGSARKASSAPYFKPAPLTGSISNSVDTLLTGVMISDD